VYGTQGKRHDEAATDDFEQFNDGETDCNMVAAEEQSVFSDCRSETCKRGVVAGDED
jgi:hypothetical protein